MIAVGDRLPEARLGRMSPEGRRTVSTGELAAGRRMVLFGVPGAFTDTCSAEHLPGFLRHAAELRQRGVDRIACVAVNDLAVMAAWGEAQGVADEILMLADGNGELTRAMGLEADFSRYGMGRRSRRYAALIDDGVVRGLWVEPGSGVTVSGAEAVLAALDAAGERGAER